MLHLSALLAVLVQEPSTQNPPTQNPQQNLPQAAPQAPASVPPAASRQSTAPLPDIEQDPDEPQDIVLPAEIVTALRSEAPATQTPSSVTVLDAEQLERTGERSLPRMIQKAALGGVFVQETNMGGGAPILRGVIGERVLIVVDGVRLNDSTTRLGPNQSLNTIDPSIVERVEIVRGPAAVLYGSDAIGGAILIWTKRRMPHDGEKQAQGGVDGTYMTVNQGTRGSVHGSYSGTKDGVYVQGSVDEWNELHSADEEQDFTGYHSNAVFGAWTRELDRNRLLRVSMRLHRDFDVPRTDRLVTGYGQTQPSNQVFDFHLQEQETYIGEYVDTTRHSFADQMQARIFVKRTTEEREIQATGSSTLREERDFVLGYGFGLDFKKALGSDHVLTYGVDLDRDDVTSTRHDTNVNTGVQMEKAGAFADNSHFTTYGVFAQDEILSFRPFDVSVGVRWSHSRFSFEPFTSTDPHEEGDFDALAGSLAVARDLGPHWRVTGTVSQAFRAPHLESLANNGAIFGGTELANPDLDPETALSGELALDYRDPLWSGGVALYHTRIDDAIGRTLVDAGNPGTTGDETYLRDNVGSVVIYGAEARLARRFASASPWGAEGTLTYTHGRQYDDTVNPLTGEATYDDVPARRIPPLFGSLALTWDALEAAQTVEWGRFEMIAAGEQDELNPDDLSDPRIDPDGTAGWATFNLDVGGALPRLSDGASWSFGLHNLLDEQYRIHGSGLDAPGFGAVLTLGWSG
jgi:outer membrane receptor protein involved in Fe transport